MVATDSRPVLFFDIDNTLYPKSIASAFDTVESGSLICDAQVERFGG